MKNLIPALILLLHCYGVIAFPGKLAHVPYTPATTAQMVRTDLYGFYGDSSLFIVDGTVSQYAAYYSDSVDGQDARKMTNPGENLGLVRNNINLVIERRADITSPDTIFFKMWNMQKKAYLMEFISSNLDHPGLQGFLEDTYLHTSTALNLNGTTDQVITITNDPASAAAFRFRIIFKTIVSAVLPVTLVSANAYLKGHSATIEWKTETENELNVDKYIVENSLDGHLFKELATIQPQNHASGQYEWVDNNPNPGHNYYRICIVDINATAKYSRVMSLNVGADIRAITIFPNPATQNNLNLQMAGQQEGSYEIRILNFFGQQVMLKSFNFSGGNGKITLAPLGPVPRGIYNLQIKKPNGETQSARALF